MVVLDAFMTFEQSEHALRIAEDTPNLVFDTSLFHHDWVIPRFIQRIGHERLVFGTDTYSHRHPVVQNRSLETILGLGLGEPELDAIFSGNLRRILRLPVQSPG